MAVWRVRALVCTLVWAVLAAHPVAAGDAETRAQRLARDFSDPLTTLPQLVLQDVYTPSSYGTEARTNRVILRALVPRIPEFSLLPLPQLVRPSVSIVTVPNGRGERTKTAFGDVQLFDLAVLPWPARNTGFLMGVGPMFVFPTATHALAGQGAWQIGPAFGAIYKGIPGLLLGCLVQNPISFAYTSPSRRPINTLLVQPIVLVSLWRGFYVKSADSTIARGWRDGDPTIVPLSLGIGWVWLREKSPANFFVTGEWTVHRQNAPVAPQATVRFGVTVAFPGWRPWS